MRITKQVLEAIADGTNYIVLYPSEELKGLVSKHYDGYWYDRNSIPTLYDNTKVAVYEWGIAKPSGDYEIREDGAVAEVWVIELKEQT